MDLERPLSAKMAAAVAKYAKLVDIPGKGKGLVAARDIPRRSVVGAYAGLVFPEKEYDRFLAQGGTTGKYAIEFFKVVGGKVKDGFVMDPGGPNDKMLPQYKNVVAAYVNEPDAGLPNCVWTRVVPLKRVVLKALRAIKKGEELSVCYAHDYPRKYKTPCKSPRGKASRISSLMTQRHI
jgi:hypothetical protein